VETLEKRLDRFLASQPGPFETTYAALAALNTPAMKDRALDALRDIVRGLDSVDTSSSTEFEPPEESPEPATRRFRAPSRPVEVQLPQRKTHGGNFGPKVRQKLMREALGD
jgi:hypothetical protein